MSAERRVPFAAVLLAGGRSVRMGRDKALLEWRGVPLWRFQLGKLIDLNPDRLLLSCRKEQDLKNIFAEFVFDPPDNPGPLGAMVRCLDEAVMPVLVLAVDMPHMTPEFLRTLLAGCEGPGGIVCRHRGLFEPLCAVYPVRALPLMREALAKGQYRMQDAVDGLVGAGVMNVRDLRDDEVPLFFNANTPDEYAWTKPAPPPSN